MRLLQAEINELRARIKGILEFKPEEVGIVKEQINESLQESLSDREFEILNLLMCSAGRAVSKEMLTNQGLGRVYIPYDRSIDVHIANLRKKLAVNGDSESIIKTIRGAGYLLVDRRSD